MAKTVKRWMRAASRTAAVLTLPMARAQALRKDDRAQVMVLGAVMVFVVMIFAMATLNTSELLHNRINNQTAVDAAADAYALWQARGLNLMQHINDIHTNVNFAAFTSSLVVCVARIFCAGDWCSDPKESFCRSRVRSCCNQSNSALQRIARARATRVDRALSLQDHLLDIMPKIGWIAANDVAKAAGADPLRSNAGLRGVIDDTLDSMVPGFDTQFVVNTYPVPGEEVHVIPYPGPPALGNIIPLPTPGIPPYGNAGPCFGVPEFCELSTCGGNRECLVAFFLGGPGALTGCESGSSPGACNYNCDTAIHDFRLHSNCGWTDYWWQGAPKAHTWIAARSPENLVGWIEDIRWLNPRFQGLIEPSDTFPDVEYSEYDEFAFFDASTGPGKTTNFINNAFVTMSASHALGSASSGGQPLQVFATAGFEYSRPQIINVHLDFPIPFVPLDDSIAEDNFIWH